MPRRNRLNLTDVPRHIIQRGDNRQAIFFAEDDYRFCLDCIVDAGRKYDCQVGMRGVTA
jgi:putative transposase